MSEFHPLLSIERLSVRNFRCFAECTLDLHPKLTVLVAENGQGKTALLHALRMALGVFVTTIGRSKLERSIEDSDIRLGEFDRSLKAIVPASFSALGWVNGGKTAWSRSVDRWRARPRNSTKDLADVQRSVLGLAAQLEQRTLEAIVVVLPLVAFYGTGRLFSENRLTRDKRWLAAANPVRFSAYLDCLSPSSSYKAFAVWYEETMRQIFDPRYKVLGRDERPEKAIIAVRESVKIVLAVTGWTEIDWEFADVDDDGRSYGSGCITVKHESGLKLPLSQLSDGVRNMVALVGDLAHRCVRLNPLFGEDAAKRTPGIVLIDEVDMHLHPRWQQSVVGLLREAFPLVQFVLTSHSPQVLSTVSKESIRALRIEEGRGITTLPAFQTRGVMSADVLSVIMGVDPVPQVPEAIWLSEYRALIENGVHDSEEGRALWSNLVTHFAENHPLLLDCQRLIRFQAFKSKNASR